MDSFLGTSDPSMMGIEVLGDLFLLVTVRTTVTEVTVLGRKLETRQVFFVDGCDWRSCKGTNGRWILVWIEIRLMNVLDVTFLIQSIRVNNRTVIVVEIFHDFVIVITGTGDSFGFILIRVFFVGRKGNLTASGSETHSGSS